MVNSTIMNTITYVLIFGCSLGLFFGCNSKPEKALSLQDTTVTIRREFDVMRGERTLIVHHDDHEIIRTLERIGKNVFKVYFRVSYTHLSHLSIQERGQDTTEAQRNLRLAKTDSLQKFLFAPRTLKKLNHLERFSVVAAHLKGDIHITGNLKHLNLFAIADSPQLKNIYFDTLINIQYLQIPRNGIKAINPSFRNLTKLKELVMFDNDLEDINLEYVPWAKRVELSDNPISLDKIDSLRLKYPKINITSYDYDEKVKQ